MGSTMGAFHGEYQGARPALRSRHFLCANSLSGLLKPPRRAKFYWQQVCLPGTSLLGLLPQAPTCWTMPALPFPCQAERMRPHNGQQSRVPTARALPKDWQERDQAQTTPFGSLASAVEKNWLRRGKSCWQNIKFGFSWSQLSRDNHELAWLLCVCICVFTCF